MPCVGGGGLCLVWEEVGCGLCGRRWVVPCVGGDGLCLVWEEVGCALCGRRSAVPCVGGVGLWLVWEEVGCVLCGRRWAVHTLLRAPLQPWCRGRGRPRSSSIRQSFAGTTWVSMCRIDASGWASGSGRRALLGGPPAFVAKCDTREPSTTECSTPMHAGSECTPWDRTS